MGATLYIILAVVAGISLVLFLAGFVPVRRRDEETKEEKEDDQKKEEKKEADEKKVDEKKEEKPKEPEC